MSDEDLTDEEWARHLDEWYEEGKRRHTPYFEGDVCICFGCELKRFIERVERRFCQGGRVEADWYDPSAPIAGRCPECGGVATYMAGMNRASCSMIECRNLFPAEEALSEQEYIERHQDPSDPTPVPEPELSDAQIVAEARNIIDDIREFNDRREAIQHAIWLADQLRPEREPVRIFRPVGGPIAEGCVILEWSDGARSLIQDAGEVEWGGTSPNDGSVTAGPYPEKDTESIYYDPDGSE